MGSQPNRTKTALLGFLSWGPISGYDLARLIDSAWDYERAADDARAVWYPG